MRRVALYVRVSTADQTIENQERELTAIAARMGCEVVSIYVGRGHQRLEGPRQAPGAQRDSEGYRATEVQYGSGIVGGMISKRQKSRISHE